MQVTRFLILPVQLQHCHESFILVELIHFVLLSPNSTISDLRAFPTYV